jgi:uncharacterized damage-inducible protein DinB
MFRKIEDFKEYWQQEAGFTTKVFDAIPDQYSSQAVNAGHRTLKRLAWHLVESVIEMPGHLGIVVDGHEMIKNNSICDPPASMAELRATYEKASASLLKGMDSWTDDTLQQEDNLYGMQFKRCATLAMLIGHQTHHRGEMFVLIRQAGLIPPDIYGPNKEGWAAMGMEPPQV